jgi:general nucleoside transport system ATP-binding protein
VLLITHKLKEIMALCDAVTVMRGGQVVLDCAIADTSIDGLAEAMVGRRVNLGRSDSAAPTPGPVLLEAQGLGWTDELGVTRLADVSLRCTRARSSASPASRATARASCSTCSRAWPSRARARSRWAAGASRPAAGSSRAGARAALAHVPEDRHKRGLVLPFDAWESAALGYQDAPRYGRAGRWPGCASAPCARTAPTMMERYDVRPRNPQLRSSKFSGGNQQKLVLAREAYTGSGGEHPPQVLLVGQPTRGVDIGAIEFIHGRLREMRDAGGAVLVVSSELDEILALADRVIVMNAGRIAGELPIADCSEAALGRLMGGAH